MVAAAAAADIVAVALFEIGPCLRMGLSVMPLSRFVFGDAG
jgi:hypothetical protein